MTEAIRSPLPILCVAIALLNLATALAFSADKRASPMGLRRTRESSLPWLAALGGSPAAFRARRRFRHKTRKQPFSFHLQSIAALQGGVAVGLLSMLVWPALAPPAPGD